MSNILNGRMGVATVTFGGVSLGHTTGGVTFHYEPKFAPIKFDQYGDTEVDEVLTGESMYVVATFGEPQAALINVATPAGGDVVGTAAERVGIGTDAGYSLRQDAKQLVLHPVDRAASDTSEDVTLYKAVATDKIEITYDPAKQRVVQVTFRALVDETNGNGRRLGHFGSTTVS